MAGVRECFRLGLLAQLVKEAADGDARADARMRRVARVVLADLEPERLVRVARRVHREYAAQCRGEAT